MATQRGKADDTTPAIPSESWSTDYILHIKYYTYLKILSIPPLSAKWKIDTVCSPFVSTNLYAAPKKTFRIGNARFVFQFCTNNFSYPVLYLLTPNSHSLTKHDNLFYCVCVRIIRVYFTSLTSLFFKTSWTHLHVLFFEKWWTLSSYGS